MLQIRTGIAVFALCVSGFAFSLSAQEQDKSKSDRQEASQQKDDKSSSKKLDPEVKKVYREIAKLLEADKLEKASKLMTSKAAERLVSSRVTQAMMTQAFFIDFDDDEMSEGLTREMREQFEKQIKEQKEATKKIAAVAKKYGLEKLKLDNKKLEFNGDMSDFEKIQKEIKAYRSKVEKALSKKKNRWEIATEFHKVSKKFNPSLFESEIIKHQIKGDLVTLELKPAVEFGDEEIEDEGVEFEFEVPHVFVNFRKTKDGWRYDGVDEKKTMEAERKMMEEMGDGDGGFGEIIDERN